MLLLWLVSVIYFNHEKSLKRAVKLESWSGGTWEGSWGLLDSSQDHLLSLKAIIFLLLFLLSTAVRALGLLHLPALTIMDGRDNFPGNQPVKVNKISEFKIKTGLVTALCPAILESKTK